MSFLANFDSMGMTKSICWMTKLLSITLAAAVASLTLKYHYHFERISFGKWLHAILLEVSGAETACI